MTAHCIFPPLYADTSHTLPPFPSADLGAHPLPERISMTDIKKLQTLYRDHCEVRPVRAQLSTSAPWKSLQDTVWMLRAEKLKHVACEGLVGVTPRPRKPMILAEYLLTVAKKKSNNLVLTTQLIPWLNKFTKIEIVHLLHQANVSFITSVELSGNCTSSK